MATDMTHVVAVLKQLGITAALEYPGWINIPHTDLTHYAVGTADVDWGMDLMTFEGECLKSWDLGPANDPAVFIASKIKEIIERK